MFALIFKRERSIVCVVWGSLFLELPRVLAKPWFPSPTAGQKWTRGGGGGEVGITGMILRPREVTEPLGQAHPHVPLLSLESGVWCEGWCGQLAAWPGRVGQVRSEENWGFYEELSTHPDYWARDWPGLSGGPFPTASDQSLNLLEVDGLQ